MEDYRWCRIRLTPFVKRPCHPVSEIDVGPSSINSKMSIVRICSGQDGVVAAHRNRREAHQVTRLPCCCLLHRHEIARLRITLGVRENRLTTWITVLSGEISSNDQIIRRRLDTVDLKRRIEDTPHIAADIDADQVIYDNVAIDLMRRLVCSGSTHTHPSQGGCHCAAGHAGTRLSASLSRNTDRIRGPHIRQYRCLLRNGRRTGRRARRSTDSGAASRPSIIRIPASTRRNSKYRRNQCRRGKSSFNHSS